ncbi:MAG: hypothetical protein Q8L41_16920 [Anaerolineales bacterium]|nr:hypothetical protein [Anaerolineales bacterium]
MNKVHIHQNGERTAMAALNINNVAARRSGSSLLTGLRVSRVNLVSRMAQGAKPA